MAEGSATGLAPGEVLGGRYRLTRLIGSGGMATVWRARDERLVRTVAVKVISDALAADPAWRARFAREARTAAQISHPHLIAVYDYGSGPGRPYLVMEHLDGGTLAERATRGPLAPHEVRRLAGELLSAIAHVHGAGVLHRDVKPANVLLDAQGRARLTDFGIARRQDATGITQPGQLLGTLHYLAPELARGAPPSPASDLYALGVLLDELPVDGQLDEDLRDLIDALRAPTPERRPAGASEALARLRGDPAAVAPTAPATAPTTAPTARTATAPAATAPTAAAAPTAVAARTAAFARSLAATVARSSHRTIARARLVAAGTLGVIALVGILLALAQPGGGHQAHATAARHGAAAPSGRSSAARRGSGSARAHSLASLLGSLERLVKGDAGG